MAMKTLVLNAGSSTLKFRLLSLQGDSDDRADVLVEGIVDKWGTPQARLKYSVAGKEAAEEGVSDRISSGRRPH